MSIRAAEGGVEIGLRVQPRASRTEVAGLLGGAIKIRLAAPPVDGAANAELIAFLAKRLGVRKGDVTLVAGRASRAKRVRVMGIGVGEVHPKLGLGEPGADQGG